MEPDRRGWIPLPLGRLSVWISWTVPVAVLALWWWNPAMLRVYALVGSALAVHEACHALAALQLGSPRSILCLHALYGKAWLHVEDPRKEWWTALAGPAANAIGAGIAFLLGGAFTWEFRTAAAASILLMAHVAMAVGNLVPIGPTDGGRAWRAWRRMRSGEAPP